MEAERDDEGAGADARVSVLPPIFGRGHITIGSLNTHLIGPNEFGPIIIFIIKYI